MYGSPVPAVAPRQVVLLALRALQLATSAVALALFASGFKGASVTLTGDDGAEIDVTVYYGGPSVTFALLVTFSASLYCLAWIVLVDVLRWGDLPAKWKLGVDAAFTVLQLSCGCALAGSDYVRYCDLLAPQVNCTLLKSGAGLCLAAFIEFLAAVGWTAWLNRFAWRRDQRKFDLRSRAISASTTGGGPPVVKMPDEYGDAEVDVMERSTAMATPGNSEYLVHYGHGPTPTSPY